MTVFRIHFPTTSAIVFLQSFLELFHFNFFHKIALLVSAKKKQPARVTFVFGLQLVCCRLPSFLLRLSCIMPSIMDSTKSINDWVRNHNWSEPDSITVQEFVSLIQAFVVIANHVDDLRMCIYICLCNHSLAAGQMNKLLCSFRYARCEAPAFRQRCITSVEEVFYDRQFDFVVGPPPNFYENTYPSVAAKDDKAYNTAKHFRGSHKRLMETLILLKDAITKVLNKTGVPLPNCMTMSVAFEVARSFVIFPDFSNNGVEVVEWSHGTPAGFVGTSDHLRPFLELESLDFVEQIPPDILASKINSAGAKELLTKLITAKNLHHDSVGRSHFQLEINREELFSFLADLFRRLWAQVQRGSKTLSPSKDDQRKEYNVKFWQRGIIKIHTTKRSIFDPLHLFHVAPPTAAASSSSTPRPTTGNNAHRHRSGNHNKKHKKRTDSNSPPTNPPDTSTLISPPHRQNMRDPPSAGAFGAYVLARTRTTVDASTGTTEQLDPPPPPAHGVDASVNTDGGGTQPPPAVAPPVAPPAVHPAPVAVPPAVAAPAPTFGVVDLTNDDDSLNQTRAVERIVFAEADPSHRTLFTTFIDNGVFPSEDDAANIYYQFWRHYNPTDAADLLLLSSRNVLSGHVFSARGWTDMYRNGLVTLEQYSLLNERMAFEFCDGHLRSSTVPDSS